MTFHCCITLITISNCKDKIGHTKQWKSRIHREGKGKRRRYMDGVLERVGETNLLREAEVRN